ncbi:hypothetical protein QBC37DRAFT_84648 [Rhypophila decipiens]|uniref:NADH dehydrogenase [ubiquinone] 1 alpha subcomplex assembly factor 3 n=1 Tax=Rhypophila decipiens TaxID=261697 RepID=A0AAN6YDN8_9PEZI|nr:hypothetical protein QBC37DRAFT_84648 [Rhypophila decipiens]
MCLSTRAGRAVVRRIESATSRQQQPYQPLSSFSTSAPRQLRSKATPTQHSNVQPLYTLAIGSRTPSRSTTTTRIPSVQATRSFHSSQPCHEKPPKQKLAHNNEPIPTEAPRTDFSQMDMLGQTPVPSTSIDVCSHDGFQFNSGAIISNGDGALLVGGEAFAWRPWTTTNKPLVNAKGQFELTRESLGILEVIWPRPDLLIIGMGKDIRPLSPETRKMIGELGMRVDVLDTRNAASLFNLLATERGVDDVAAVLVPLGWKA